MNYLVQALLQLVLWKQDSLNKIFNLFSPKSKFYSTEPCESTNEHQKRQKLYRQNIAVVLDLGFDRERLVSEVSQTSGQLLCWAIVLVVIHLGAVIDHRHDVWVVVLVVIVERVKEDAETIPLIWASKDRSFEALGCGEPEGQAVSSNPASTGHSEVDFNLPPIESAGKETKALWSLA